MNHIQIKRDTVMNDFEDVIDEDVKRNVMRMMWIGVVGISLVVVCCMKMFV